MKNVRKHIHIKLVTTNKQRTYLEPNPIYHTTKCFLDSQMAVQMNNINVKLNEPVNLGL